MGFVANFIHFQQCKNFENRRRFYKVTDSSKVGTFLRHSVDFHLSSQSVASCFCMFIVIVDNLLNVPTALIFVIGWKCSMLTVLKVCYSKVAEIGFTVVVLCRLCAASRGRLLASFRACWIRSELQKSERHWHNLWHVYSKLLSPWFLVSWLQTCAIHVFFLTR